MYPDHIPVRENLRTAHAEAWQRISKAGDFYSGTARVDFVRVARDALTCELCRERKAAISPNSVTGEHETFSSLDPVVVDMIHRLRTDPGRLTKAFFDEVTQIITAAEYVEIVSVVNSSVIIDTMHNAVGLGLPPLPLPARGRPRGQMNELAVDAGAWVPILDAPQDIADTGLPTVPNIARALGLVQSAVDLFFTTFRPHYTLKNLPLSISQAQAEFVAARVSAMNECFY